MVNIMQKIQLLPGLPEQRMFKAKRNKAQEEPGGTGSHPRFCAEAQPVSRNASG